MPPDRSQRHRLEGTPRREIKMTRLSIRVHPWLSSLEKREAFHE